MNKRKIIILIAAGIIASISPVCGYDDFRDPHSPESIAQMTELPYCRPACMSDEKSDIVDSNIRTVKDSCVAESEQVRQVSVPWDSDDFRDPHYPVPEQ